MLSYKGKNPSNYGNVYGGTEQINDAINPVHKLQVEGDISASGAIYSGTEELLKPSTQTITALNNKSANRLVVTITSNW